MNMVLIAECLILIGCSDKLKIEPEGILTEDQVFSSAITAELALGAVYNTFMRTSIGSAYMYGDVTTQNIEVIETAFFSFINAEYPVNDTDVLSFWSGYYTTINLANNVINKIDEIGSYDEQVENQHIAEAKFIRALCYFNLLKYFGDGALTGNSDGMCVPIQLKEYDGSGINEYIPRNSNGEVYEQIILDLTSAVPDLPEMHTDPLASGSRATAGSANALLSRVYLYSQQYEEAATAADDVISSMIYDLEPDLRTLFPTSTIRSGAGEIRPFTSEDIFNLPIGTNASGSFANSTNIGKNNIFYGFTASQWVSDDLISAFEASDNRKLQLIVEGWTGETVDEGFDALGNQLAANLMTYKFGPTNEENVPYIRLGEIMLTRSEALARINGLGQESIDLLNIVRERSVPTAIPLLLSDFATADALISRILLERRVELMFESHERYDLIRTERKNKLRNPDLPDNRLVMPIPQSEVDLSGGIIKQNLGYN